MQKLLPGIYQCTVPYLTYHRTAREDGYHRVRTVDVEIHVGRKEDLLDGKVATIIAYSTTSFSNYVQDVFRNIRRLFFRSIFPSNENIPNFLENHIRYLEVHAKSQDLNDWHELEMHWDTKNELYTHPVWNSISSDAWYFQQYQQKIRYFAEQGLQYFEGINPKHHLEDEDWTMERFRLCETSPSWLLLILQETKNYVQEHELGIDPCALVANSLKKLAGFEINRLLYTPIITTFVVDQIHKLKTPEIAHNYVKEIQPFSGLHKITKVPLL